MRARQTNGPNFRPCLGAAIHQQLSKQGFAPPRSQQSKVVVVEGQSFSSTASGASFVHVPSQKLKTLLSQIRFKQSKIELCFQILRLFKHCILQSLTAPKGKSLIYRPKPSQRQPLVAFNARVIGGSHSLLPEFGLRLVQ